MVKKKPITIQEKNLRFVQTEIIFGGEFEFFTPLLVILTCQQQTAFETLWEKKK